MDRIKYIRLIYNSGRIVSFYLAILFLCLFPITNLMADFESAMGFYIQGDYATAHREFSTLANEGNVDAQIVLGDMYANGEGVKQNYIQAYKWYDIAAKNGSKGAALSRDAITKKMDTGEITEALRLANEWQPGMEDHTEAVTTTFPAEADQGSSPPAGDQDPEDSKKSGGFFSNLSRNVTGWVGGTPSSSLSSESTTGTIGVRGLGAEELRAAQPDLDELEKMENYSVSVADAVRFADDAILTPQQVAYLQDEFAESDTQAAPEGSEEVK